MVYKKVIISLLFLLTVSLVGRSSDLESALPQADACFEKAQYKEAYVIYDSLFNAGFVSNSMLLKMAFIDESREKPEKAIYYLSLLEKRSGNESVHSKILDVANSNGFEGYDNDNLFDVFKSYLIKYSSPLLILIAVSILLASVLANKMLLWRMMSILACLLLAVVIQSTLKLPEDAIVQDDTLVYKGESLASEVVKEVSKGTKIDVFEVNSFWNKIDDEHYVNSKNILLIK